jgi:hypothetical protein
MRQQPDEAQGLAELSIRTRIPVDELPLRRAIDRGREEELRAAAKERLLTMAGLTPERSKVEVHLGELKTRFGAMPQLHEGIQWADVEKSLRADPESMAKLQALDAKGHSMNVFGEENGEFIFASAWRNYEQVSEDHRNIVFDKEAQEKLAREFRLESCNGNAIDIARALGVDLADTKLHEQLSKVKLVTLTGRAWLKTVAAIRQDGDACSGSQDGTIMRHNACNHSVLGSFRAELRVKKA